MRSATVFMLVLFLGACSNKQVYEAVQHNEKVECGNLPQERYEQCMKELDTSYEEYEEARKDRP